MIPPYALLDEVLAKSSCPVAVGRYATRQLQYKANHRDRQACAGICLLGGQNWCIVPPSATGAIVSDCLT